MYPVQGPRGAHFLGESGLNTKFARILLLATAVLLADQLSKLLVISLLYLGESRPIIQDFFHLSYVSNPGAAFGILPDQRGLFLVLAFFVLASVLYLALKIAGERMILQYALGFILGGTLGNLVDRLFRGRVVDFLDFRVWPVFNVADMALVVGALLLLVFSIPAARDSMTKKSVPGRKEPRERPDFPTDSH